MILADPAPRLASPKGWLAAGWLAGCLLAAGWLAGWLCGWLLLFDAGWLAGQGARDPGTKLRLWCCLHRVNEAV